MIKILILDDDPQIKKLISHYLKDKEYELCEAIAGLDVLQQMKTLQPDIVLLDLEMPNMDCFEVIEKIKQNSLFNLAYIIFLSAKLEVDDKVTGLSLGADDYLTKPVHPKELIARIEAGIRTVEEKHSAYKDSLTQLYNKNFFDVFCGQVIKESERYNKPVSLGILDIDFFKQVNDNFGHETGDTILQELSTMLQEVCRDTDLACRWGGEEFVLLMVNTDQKGAQVIAERLRQKVASSEFSVVESLTISIGLAQYAGDKDQWFENADSALYKAKESGRNRVVLYDQAGEKMSQGM